jgi:hypothetical protein
MVARWQIVWHWAAVWACGSAVGAVVAWFICRALT